MRLPRSGVIVRWLGLWHIFVMELIELFKDEGLFSFGSLLFFYSLELPRACSLPHMVWSWPAIQVHCTLRLLIVLLFVFAKLSQICSLENISSFESRFSNSEPTRFKSCKNVSLVFLSTQINISMTRRTIASYTYVWAIIISTQKNRMHIFSWWSVKAASKTSCATTHINPISLRLLLPI